MQFHQAKRRAFITLLGGAAAWPLLARAQQSVPVAGFLHISTLGAWMLPVDGFQRGLREAGYIQGQNSLLNFAGRKVISNGYQPWPLI